MKPQDLAIILKIILLQNKEWRVVDIANNLYLSQSEVSKALARLAYSGLIDEEKKHPAKSAVLDFIKSAVKYVFPARPGRLLRGVPTSHSAPPLKSKIRSENKYVWPHLEGKIRGESIEPLYRGAVEASLNDPELYEVLSLIDSLRVGKVREQELAIKELEKRLR